MKKVIVKAKDTPKDTKTMLDVLEEDLQKDGIRLPEYSDVDEEYSALPKYVTEVESKELGEYLNSFTQQKVWIRTVSGRVSLLLKETEHKLDIKKARIFSNLPQKMAMKEKELNLLLDPETETLVKQYDYLESKLRILEDIIYSLEESIFSISREISRRGKDFDEFNRGENSGWGKTRERRKK